MKEKTILNIIGFSSLISAVFIIVGIMVEGFLLFTISLIVCVILLILVIIIKLNLSKII